MANLPDSGKVQDIIEEYQLAKNSIIEVQSHQKKIIDEMGNTFKNPQFQFDPFLDLIKETMLLKVNGNHEFDYKPEHLSYTLYGSHDLWYLLLRLNGCMSRNDFIGPIFNVIKMENINDVLNILRSSQRTVEKSSIYEYKDLTIRPIKTTR